MTYLRHAEKSKGTLAGPTDLQIKVQADLPSEKRVLEILADLSDARRIQINRQGRGRAITTFADRFDDSDEISARIQARNSVSNLQKSAVCGAMPRS